MAKLWLVVATLMIWGTGCGKKDGEGGKTGGPKKPLSVDFQIVKKGISTYNLKFPGSVVAREMVEITPETAGRITHIGFVEGREVSSGQVLVKLNDDELLAQMKKLNAQLKLASDDAERKRSLIGLDGVTREELDQAEGNLRMLEAEKELLEARIQKLTIHAPFSGKIGIRSVSKGAWVNPGQVLASLYQQNPLDLEFDIPDYLVSRFPVGTEIEFLVARGDMRGKARISNRDAGLKPGTRSLTLQAEIANPPEGILPGSVVEVLINPSPGKEIITIPSGGVVPVLGGEQVFLVKAGAAVPVRVKTGVRTPTEVEILDGLAVGDTLVLSGLLQIKPGMKVIPRRPAGLEGKRP